MTQASFAVELPAQRRLKTTGIANAASFTTVDLSGNWQATDAFSVFASVQNVADRIAPLDPLSYGGFNYNPLDSSGAIGRFFTVDALHVSKPSVRQAVPRRKVGDDE